MKLYAERDIENLDTYFDHVMAMTGEALYSKSAIAAELAFRDNRIAELESLNRAVGTELDRVQPLFEKMKEVVNAVAYVGVDFGYGPYKLEASVIQTARILSENKQAGDL